MAQSRAIPDRLPSPTTLNSILQSRLAFTLCEHTTPMTPRPLHTALRNQPNSSSCSGRFVSRCIHCDISYRTSSQRMVLELYNGMIGDQRSAVLVASDQYITDIRTDRRDTREIIALAREDIEHLRWRRDREVDAVWSGFEEKWNGALEFVRERNWFGEVVKVERVRVRLERAVDGGLMPRGLV